mgnify:CR=1 FL=1
MSGLAISNASVSASMQKFVSSVGDTFQATTYRLNQSRMQWARKLEVSPFLIYGRLRKGWSDEETLKIPVKK